MTVQKPAPLDTHVPARTLIGLAADLEQGRSTSRALVEACLDRIERTDDPSRPAFLSVARESALNTADAMDRLRAHAIAPSEFAGIPISVKDLFDVVGQKTRAGSRVLEDAPHSRTDAEAVYRLRRAGFIVIGRTNMTEFAYSGLGLNPHFGTPENPSPGLAGRIPGGSSSGGAVSVARGLAYAALATDTGGSSRIPAAFCGLVGFKSTASRISCEGVIPLSPSLDSIGWMARSVSCVAVLDRILSGKKPLSRYKPMPKALRLGIPGNIVFDQAEAGVIEAFETCRGRLERAGVEFVELDLPEFDEVDVLLSNGGIVAAESYAWHRELIKHSADLYDKRVLRRLMLGARQQAADYIDTLSLRGALIERIICRMQGVNALAFPTVAVAPPAFADLEDDAEYDRINRLVLRNAMMANLFDGCSISLPVPGYDGIGFMLMSIANDDENLLSMALEVENIIRIKAS